MVTNDGWNDSGGHTVGAARRRSRPPLTEWSTLHGDLRITHFAGLHALQVLPLVAWVLAAGPAWMSGPGPGWSPSPAPATSGCSLCWRDRRSVGRLLRPDATTLSALAVLLVASVTAVGLVLRQRTVRPSDGGRRPARHCRQA